MQVIILLSIIGAAFALPQRIVGGEATTIETYPFMVNLQLDWFGIFWSQHCGGSIITPTAVLSSAHCFYDKVPSEWLAIVGATLPSGADGQRHSIARFALHQQYNNNNYDNDIAIVHLNAPATYSNRVAAARVAGSGYFLADGTPVTAIGYGALYASGPAPSQMQHVEVNIINQQVCAQRYKNLQSQPGWGSIIPDVNDNMLCAGILDIGGKDACQRDSGGPVVHDNDIVVGIISWGRGCADGEFPGVYARVSHFTNWIIANA